MIPALRTLAAALFIAANAIGEGAQAHRRKLL